MKREWRTIPFATNYEVSNYGEVRNKKTDYIKKQPAGRGGYSYVNLCCDDGKEKVVSVHRLVAQSFIPNPFNKLYVNHKDFNRTNNNVGNLEWVTMEENNLWSLERCNKTKVGISRSSETKRKMSATRLEKYKRTLPPHIYKTMYGSYVFYIARNGKSVVSKTLKTLEEAIEFKTNWEKEHQEVMSFT